MDWLKSLWASWKVRVSLVGGVLVVATAYGTCEVDPSEVSENTTGETATEAPADETVKVSSTTEAEVTEEDTTGTTENSGETTTETTTE